MSNWKKDSKALLGKRSKQQWLSEKDITLEELEENQQDILNELDLLRSMLEAIAEVVGCTDLPLEDDDGEMSEDLN